MFWLGVYFDGGEALARIWATEVELGATSVTFGSTRIVADFNRDEAPATWDAHLTANDYCVVDDNILGLFALRLPSDPPTVFPNKAVRTSYVTVPNDGLGTAGVEDMYVWVGDNYETLHGCGHTLSHDASYALANSNGIGSACVPNTKNDPGMDHKGFYITPFRHTYHEQISLDEHVDVYGTSINWCPTEYRLGLYSEVDFTDWNFSNSTSYVIGILKGSAIVDLGMSFNLWVVEWAASKWTPLAPHTTSHMFIDPALYLPGQSSVDKSSRRSGADGSALTRVTSSLSVLGESLAVPKGIRRVVLHDLSGRVVWQSRLSGLDKEMVAVPSALRGAAVVARFEGEER
ncbi:MAG: hypothetical protein GF331_13635 [Chitinivibrionales bacterium]|nr:hypothetical protein [Chitinivibrionales bacterium]